MNVDVEFFNKILAIMYKKYQKSNNVLHQFNRLKKKNHMIISINEKEKQLAKSNTYSRQKLSVNST